MATVAPDGQTLLVSAPPAPALRRVVIEYRGFVAGPPCGPAARALPSIRVPLVLDLGAGWWIRTPATNYDPLLVAGFAAGMHDSFALVEAAGPTLGVQIDLTPGGARRLLGEPMSELSNRVVSLDDLLGSKAPLLMERLAAAPTWPKRFAAIDAALIARLATAAPVMPGVSWAWAQLIATGGRGADRFAGGGAWLEPGPPRGQLSRPNRTVAESRRPGGAVRVPDNPVTLVVGCKLG